MLDPLYHAVAWLMVTIHSGLVHIPLIGDNSGATWSLSIVFLTMLMRLLLFPLFVKQIKTQRAMQVLQPKMKELQQKYKGDRERLNQELMGLYREHGTNPLSGCLPILLQIPVFFALFHVLNSIRPDAKTLQYPTDVVGFPSHLIEGAAKAKLFGAPIAAAFNSPTEVLRALEANPTSVKVVAVILVVLMGATTFITQRQLIARTGASGNNQFATQQKILLYVLPFTFFIFGFQFPLGVLLYWLTTNVWSMAQQAIVIGRMGTPATPEVAGATTAATTSPPPAAPAPRRKPTPPTTASPTRATPPSAPSSPPAAPRTPAPTPGGDAPRRPDNRSRKRARRRR